LYFILEKDNLSKLREILMNENRSKYPRLYGKG